MVPDLVKCYGAGGRTIIFCETKRDANDLTVALAESVGTRALHGDIPQVWIPAVCPWLIVYTGSCMPMR